MSTYIYDQAWEAEHERLQALEELYDKADQPPGGWVVVEDADVVGPMISILLRYVVPSEHAAVVERVVRASNALFAAAGGDLGLGARLPGLLLAAGLSQVGAELHGRFVWGGGHRDFVRLSMEHLRDRLVDTGLITGEELERFLALSQQPDFGYLSLPIVTAWGQRAGS